MKASEWIDRAKTLHSIESDYGIAKALGLSRQTVSGYRNRIATLDEESAIRVANFLGERPEAVLLDQYAERTKSPEVRTALLDAARRLCILCKVPNASKMRARYARRVSAAMGFHSKTSSFQTIAL